MVLFSTGFILANEPIQYKREIVLKPSSKPVFIRTQNDNNLFNQFTRELDTLYYDDGNVSTGYHGWRALFWAVRFTPVHPCTVKAGIFQIWDILNVSPLCTLFVWDDNGGHPGSVVDGPIIVKASSVPSWNRGDFTGGYTDADDFWFGYWLPYADDTLWCATDSSTDYGDRRAVGFRIGSGWVWNVYPSFEGDLMIRAIVSYGAPDIDVTPDTLIFKLILPDAREGIIEPSTGRDEDTVKIDDGILSGWGTNGELSLKEGVKLTPAGPCTLFAVLYYPGDPNNQNPSLHWSVWDDDGPNRFPGTQVANGTITNPVYGNWYRVNLPTPVYFIGGSFYAGWEDLTSPSIYMGLDSSLDGYNYWYNGTTWLLDNFFPGDFMIRGIVHYWQPSDTDTVKIMTINNVGIDSLFVDSIIPGDSWIISIVPNTLRIPAKSTDYVTVTVTRNGLSSGIHYSSLSIYSNDPEENPYIEPVKFILQYGGAVEEEPSMKQYNYHVNFFPNPMSTRGTMVYTIPTKTDVRISIYDIAGRLIRRLVDRKVNAGTHTVLWDRKNKNGIKVPQGIYFYNFVTQIFKKTGKITVIR